MLTLSIDSGRDYTRDLAHTICEDAFGVIPKYIKKFESGVINKVYEIGLENEQKYVLRISEHPEDTLTSEIWAIETARRTGVPVADILNTGEVKLNDKLLRYSLQSFASGEPLAEYLKRYQKSEEIKASVGRSVGKILARIHSVETKGFGYIEDGHGTYATKDEWLARLFIKRDELQEFLGDSLDIEMIFSIIRSGVIEDYGVPSLLHGDFKLDHIFIDSPTREVSGVIDFEEATSGDPVLDIVTWDYHSGDVINTKYVKIGYEENRKLGDNFSKRYRAMYLYKCLNMLRYYSIDSPQDLKVQKIRSTIQTLLNEN